MIKKEEIDQLIIFAVGELLKLQKTMGESRYKNLIGDELEFVILNGSPNDLSKWKSIKREFKEKMDLSSFLSELKLDGRIVMKYFEKDNVKEFKIPKGLLGIVKIAKNVFDFIIESVIQKINKSPVNNGIVKAAKIKLNQVLNYSGEIVVILAIRKIRLLQEINK